MVSAARVKIEFTKEKLNMKENPVRQYIIVHDYDIKTQVIADDLTYITDDNDMMTVTLKLKGETVGHFTNVKNWVRQDLTTNVEDDT